jgi:2-octaprenyl-6-methoxyphenol hydroxylase
METCDVLIVGGGLVGASLAIALDRSGLSVALAESAAPRVDAQPSYDERNLALARASVNALTALGVWAPLSGSAAPIRKIHISRQGEFGAVRLDAKLHDLDAFGAVVPARELGNALLRRLDACAQLQRFAPATVKSIGVDANHATARLHTIDGEHTINARLLVGADGTNSLVREALGIGVDRFDYEQTAFVFTVTTERAMDSAYERFTATGPTALLPLGERRGGVVLTVPSDDAERVANLDDAGFLDLLHSRFGWKLGRFSRPGKRVSYPLRRVCAQRLTSTRAVLVGNAAQTLHPIAAQGFNLGLRDALTLAERVQRADDPGSATLLADYAQTRSADRDGTIAMSDGLARWTRDESLPLTLARSFGMIALDRIAPLQSILIDRGMGFRGDIPSLAARSVP